MGSDSSVQAYWKGLYDTRLDWALQAYQRFMHSLDERTRRCFVDHDREATVVLFGRTQVGKTTLLLQLLGIDGSHMKHVSEILRGGRDIGKSATATAMQYQRSPDDRWRLHIDKQVSELDSEELVAALRHIRDAVEAGRQVSEDPVIISIPKSLFRAENRMRVAVRILDLPGDKPTNANEQQHVNRIAERYVPNADLILMVGRADGLSFLNPQGLSVPGIRDWRYTPQRFRIVTTYSFTLKTIMDWANGGEIRNAAAYRERLLSEIAKFDLALSGDAANPRLYFPLEFGTSWEKLETSDPELYQRVNPVMAELYEELMQDIAEAATPHGRIRQAANAPMIAAQIKRDEEQKMLADEEIIQADIDSLDKEWLLLEKSIAAKTARERAMQDYRNACAQLIDKLSAATEQHFRLEFEMPGTDRQDFYRTIGDVVGQLVSLAARFDPVGDDDCYQHLRLPIIDDDDVRRAARSCFFELEERLATYSIDTYYPRLSKSHENDSSELHFAINRAGDRVAGMVLMAWRECVRSQFEEAAAALKRSVVDLRASWAIHAKVLGKLDWAHAELTRLQQERMQFCADMDLVIERGRRFFSLLEESFAEEKQRRHHVLAAAPNPSVRLLDLLGMTLLHKEREKLFSGT